MTDPTPDQVRGLWQHMQAVYGSEQFGKATSALMKLIGEGLALFGVQDPGRFMSIYSTTIGTRIYTPFDPGVPDDHHTLWGQMITAAHEHEHVHQYLTEGAGFAAKYLARPASRAAYEAEALRCELELYFWRFGRIDPWVSPADLSGRLVAYGCNAAEIADAARILELSSASILAGGRVSHAAATAISWLEANALEIQDEEPPARARRIDPSPPSTLDPDSGGDDGNPGAI